MSTDMQRQAALLALRLIAATAAKLADDLERNRLWPGDLTRSASVIAAALRDVKEESTHG